MWRTNGSLFGRLKEMGWWGLTRIAPPSEDEVAMDNHSCLFEGNCNIQPDWLDDNTTDARTTLVYSFLSPANIACQYFKMMSCISSLWNWPYTGQSIVPLICYMRGGEGLTSYSRIVGSCSYYQFLWNSKFGMSVTLIFYAYACTLTHHTHATHSHITLMQHTHTSHSCNTLPQHTPITTQHSHNSLAHHIHTPHSHTATHTQHTFTHHSHMLHCTHSTHMLLADVVSCSKWWHILVVTIPDNLTFFDKAIIYVTSGDNRGSRWGKKIDKNYILIKFFLKLISFPLHPTGKSFSTLVVALLHCC